MRIATERCVVGVEGAERVGEELGGRAVDGIARVRPVDGHDRDGTVVLDANRVGGHDAMPVTGHAPVRGGL